MTGGDCPYTAYQERDVWHEGHAAGTADNKILEAIAAAQPEKPQAGMRLYEEQLYAAKNRIAGLEYDNKRSAEEKTKLKDEHLALQAIYGEMVKERDEAIRRSIHSKMYNKTLAEELEVAKQKLAQIQDVFK
jgi:hypothetical protein